MLMHIYLNTKSLVDGIKAGKSLPSMLSDIYDGIFDGRVSLCAKPASATPYPLVIPRKMVAFHTFRAHPVPGVCVHFFISDRGFAAVRNNPMKYIPLLQQAQCVVCPDFSQYLSMPPKTRFINSMSNKVLGELWRSEGITTIPNVTWSTPDSYGYSFFGVSTDSVIAINSNGILKADMAKYYWRQGYKAALAILRPRRVLRYGPIIPGEKTSISTYYPNERLNFLRYGR